MNIAVIGTGYVGLVTGTCFAETGNHVICVDNNKAKVESMQKSVVPIYEPHLDALFHRNVEQKRLSFTTNLAEGIKDAQIIFLALPTPPGDDGSADLSYVLGVAKEIGTLLSGYKVVINKSTVPVGTAEKVRAEISKTYKGEFDVVSNPEFLREGFAVDDFLKPDRVVIGVRSQRQIPAMKSLYEPFNAPVVITDINSAELIKHAANSFLALKISYINAVSVICEASGANVQEVANGMGMDG